MAVAYTAWLHSIWQRHAHMREEEAAAARTIYIGALTNGMMLIVLAMAKDVDALPTRD